MTVIANPNLDHATLLLFEKNFERLAANKDTKLLNCPAIKHMDIKGISNISRIEGNDLVDVTGSGRNPSKQYLTIRNDNRKSVAKRFTGTYLVDSYDRAVKLITDPTSDLFQNLKEAKNRLTDKCIIDAAVGSVTVGAPDAEGSTLTAAQDGVVTIAGTSTFNYSTVISPAITQFKNQYVDTYGVTLAISATEEQALRDDDKYMNALYSNQHTVDKGTITNASDINEKTKQSEKCKMWYDTVRKSLLMNMNASFSIKRAVLAEVADFTPVYGYTKAFSLPHDCLQVLNMDSPIADRYYQIEGNYFYCNQYSEDELIKIRYIADIQVVCMIICVNIRKLSVITGIYLR